jgi:precorrin-2 dehydrogenase/sirohydrochlorin ferrochelatase
LRQGSLIGEKSGSVAPTYYPAFLNLREKRCVVVGGGPVAARKVTALLRCGAAVTVISPTLSDSLLRQHDKGLIGFRRRNYRKGDLAKAFLVVAATADPQVNEKIAREAPCLINVVDRPQLGNFIVPSRVSRGPLTIAVSTSGASPGLSREIRREMSNLYDKRFGEFFSFAAKLRRRLLRDVSDREVRARILNAVASHEVLQTLRGEGFAAARERVMKLVSQAAGMRGVLKGKRAS